MKKKLKPPRLSRWMLERMTSEYHRTASVGDLDEEFGMLRTEAGAKTARKWYRRQLMKSIPFFLNHFSYRSWDMTWNYFKTALRNIRKHKVYAFINIVGLAAGLACFMMISLWVRDELSFDQFHLHKHRLCRPVSQWQSGNITTTSSWALGPALKDKIPEIEDFARVWFWHRSLVKYGDQRFDEENFYLADPSIFTMFTFPFVHGDPEMALNEINAIVLTQETANRYFGNDDPLGKVLHLAAHEQDFVVRGVIENIPPNSTFQFDMVARIELMGKRRLESLEFTGYSFVMLREGVSVNDANRKIVNFYRDHFNPEYELNLLLQPFTRMHLYASGEPGGIKQVYIFSVIAIFILLIACVNFMNLSTAKSAIRAKEVGMRKVTGATRSQLMHQFLGESLLFAMMAFVLAVVVVMLVMPAFNGFTGKQLGLFDSLQTWLVLLAIVPLTGLAAGAYPAIVLSSLQPIKSLTRRAGSRSRGMFRKVLVVFQFTISIGLIVCTLAVGRQMSLVQTMDLGLDRDHVVMLRNNETLRNRFDEFSTELKRMPGVINATSSMVPPTSLGQAIEIDWAKNSDSEGLYTNYTVADFNFIETFDLEMVQGRSFSREFVTDAKQACIINETLAKHLGLDAPLGEQITINYSGFDDSERKVRVVGVVKDFHFQSLRNRVGPFLMKIHRPWHNYLYIKINDHDRVQALQNIEIVFKQFAPDYPFKYEFLDDYYNQMYQSEMQLGRLFHVFGSLAVFISCLGLLGLSAFMAEQKTKEVGIRKVLGAGVSGIMIMLSKSFTKWVLISNIIAMPIAYWLMRHWLQVFAYKITLEPDLFVLAGLIALTIAVLTVGIQAMRAALANPVDALKYE